MTIQIGDSYKFIIDDYISTDIKYFDYHGNMQHAWGTIELYPYDQNDEIKLPCYDKADYEGHVEDGQHIIVLDIIESASFKTSKLYQKTITRDNRIDVVFLLKNKKYIYDLNFFLKITEKVGTDDRVTD